MYIKGYYLTDNEILYNGLDIYICRLNKMCIYIYILYVDIN